MAIDGHFIVEQTVRSRSGFFLNFNGTAGLWRRACIEDAGGWQYDTLTEDLDLSYRAQMRGWKIDYLPDVVVPAELPSQVEAFKKQQFRWAKGSFQVVRKILPQVFERSDLPWRVRLLAALHLTGYIVHPLMLSLLLLTLPVGTLIPATFKIFPPLRSGRLRASIAVSGRDRSSWPVTARAIQIAPAVDHPWLRHLAQHLHRGSARID